MTPAIDTQEVRDALETRAVLEHYGWKYRKSGSQFESAACPQRPDHSRRAFVISSSSGRWRCFPCGSQGDLFDFVAEVERLDVERDFPEVVRRAAAIAGVGPSTMSEEERRARREAVAAKRKVIEDQERAARAARDRDAVPRATRYWSHLVCDHPRGRAYLAERGIAEAAPLVRYDLRHEGSPAIPLHTSDAQIRNVVRRRLPELGEPKTPGLYECPTAGTLLGSVRQIGAGRIVVVTEGVVDSLTAAIAWPGAVILGAHSADNLPAIVRVAAPRCAAAGVPLLLVPHNDGAGYTAALAGAEAAVEAGLSVRRRTLAIVKHRAQDLNDAWRDGWRPAA